jgi:type IV pilus assembly protein PilY1
MKTKFTVVTLALALAGLVPAAAMAQSTLVVSENFTGGTTNNSWYYINGACLTAGTLASTATTSPGSIPACQIGSTVYPYYVTNFALSSNINGGAAQLDGGDTGTLPDTLANGGGALRLTNDSYAESGAIISNFSFPLSSQGLSVTFTTETYGGNSGGSGGDGADGISFFLQDASYATPTLGDWGGSLGYTCSNVNNSTTQGYDGMVGGYIGLGIDEYGNFLNGTVNSTNSPTTYNAGADNTSSGYGYVWNRVGLRGQGSTAWSQLNGNSATSAYYPSTLTAAQRNSAVRLACQSGIAWNFSAVTPATPSTGGSTTANGHSYANPYSAVPVPTVPLTNYGVIPGAYKILSTQIANEDALYRGYATPSTTGDLYGIPITYQLTITTGGLLSLAYSYNGGAYNQILTNQSITASNGSLPDNVRFGFAASTGGSTNIHEIMCFQAAPQSNAATSAGINLKQTAKVQTGTQVYFAFYNSNNWTGSLTSQYLDIPTGGTSNDLQIDPVVNWDASCVLTGVASGASCATTGVDGPTSAMSPSSRVMLTWSGSAGEPFEPPSPGPGVTSAQITALNVEGGPYNANTDVLYYLRGVRTFENTSYGGGEFRQRTSVLGDIIDSSPTWVGPPQSGYPATWSDKLFTAQTPAENSGTTYTTYAGSSGSLLRENVVYSGANDGFMHGYRTGSFDATNSYITTTYPNDGHEVMAYMPGYILNLINSYTTDPSDDYVNIQYAHNFNVDGTPGTGDLFYGGAWHTWLVAGLGAGGPAIYALDITNPSNFSESNASSLVVGEWSVPITTTTTTTKTCVRFNPDGSCRRYSTTTTTTTAATPTFTCVGNSTCGNNMGNTYGVPQIRRFHNGQWGAVLGNGFNSATGDAGIYIMLVPTSGTPSTSNINLYYISTSTGSSGSPNGIAYVTPADLDGDHVVDYVYAGDLQGNVWRFDLTSATPATWASTSPYKVYTTGTGSAPGNPISTKLVVASVPGTGSANPRVLVEFGTGLHTPLTDTTTDSYQTGQQYLFGIWDWNMTSWNGKSTTMYDALSSATVPGFAASGGPAALKQQTITGSFDANLNASSATSTTQSFSYRTVSANSVCWADLTSCSSTPYYGWYLGLAYGHANPYDANGLSTTANTADATVYEQVLFNPILADGAFIVNTTIPPTNSLATCASTPTGGWTMAINPATGGAFATSFFADSGKNFLNISNQSVSGVALNGTGSPDVVAQGSSTYIVTQTTSGTGAIEQINPPGNVTGSRLTWIQRR